MLNKNSILFFVLGYFLIICSSLPLPGVADECRQFYTDLFNEWSKTEENALHEYLNFSKKITTANDILKLKNGKTELYSCVSESRKFNFCLGMKPEESYIVQPDPTARGEYGDGVFKENKFFFSWKYGTKVVKSVYWSTSGDPWYEIGSRSGYTSYRVLFSKDYSKFKYSVEGNETIFKGDCAKIDRFKLTEAINPLIKSIYFNSLFTPNYNPRRYLNYVINDGELHHVMNAQYPNISIKNLSNNSIEKKYFEKIIDYKPANITNVADYLNNITSQFKISDFFNDSKNWSCIFYNNQSLMQKPNFFYLKIRNTTNQTLPSELNKLGYNLLGSIQLIGSWPDNNWHDRHQMILIDLRSGQKAFIGKNNKISISDIRSLYKGDANTKFGLDYHLLRLDDLLCFSK